MSSPVSIDHVVVRCPQRYRRTLKQWHGLVALYEKRCKDDGLWFRVSDNDTVIIGTSEQTLRIHFDRSLEEISSSWSGSLMRVGHDLDWNIHNTFVDGHLEKSLTAVDALVGKFIKGDTVKDWHVLSAEFTLDVGFGILTDLGACIEAVRDIRPASYEVRGYRGRSAEWVPSGVDQKRSFVLYDKGKQIAREARRERAGSPRREQAQTARNLVGGVLRFEVKGKADFIRQRLRRRGSQVMLSEILFPQVPREVLLWVLEKKLGFRPGGSISEDEAKLPVTEFITEARRRWPKKKDNIIFTLFTFYNLLHSEEKSVKQAAEVMQIGLSTAYRYRKWLRELGVQPEAGPAAMAVLARIHETAMEGAASWLSCPFRFDEKHCVIGAEGEERNPKDDEDDDAWAEADVEDDINAILDDLLEYDRRETGDRDGGEPHEKLTEDDLRLMEELSAMAEDTEPPRP